MKKIKIFILSLLVAFSCIASSCDDVKTPNETTNTINNTSGIYSDIDIDWNLDHYWPPEEIPYLTFEEMCENVATDVVIAGLVSEEMAYYYPGTDIGSNTGVAKYVFDVRDTLIGDANGQIRVYASTMYCIADDGTERGMNFVNLCDWNFETDEDINQDLLLVLIKCDPERYNDDHAYEWYGAPVIFLDNLSDSQMYLNMNHSEYFDRKHALSNHISGIDMDNCTREEFIEYVCSLVKNQKQ